MADKETKSLAGISVFESLSKESLQRVQARCTWRTYDAEEVILRRGEKGEEVHFLTEGRVRVYDYSLSGHSTQYAELGAGTIFGELSVFDDLPRSAYVVALESSTVAALPGAEFREFLEKNPEVSWKLFKLLAGIIREADRRIAILSSLKAKTRIGAELLRLARREAGNRDSAVISPVPSYPDLAVRCCTVRDHVSRCIGELRRKELLQREASLLRIVDLRKFASHCELGANWVEELLNNQPQGPRTFSLTPGEFRQNLGRLSCDICR